MQADVSLQKDVLTCSQVSLGLWKIKYLSNTESELGLSSEDEAVGMPLHKTVARRLPGYRVVYQYRQAPQLNLPLWV